MKKVMVLLVMVIILVPTVSKADKIISIGGVACHTKADAILLSNLSIHGGENSITGIMKIMMDRKCISVPGNTEVKAEFSFKGDVDGIPATFYAIRIPSDEDRWYVRGLEIGK
jgi:hypothetical protein